MADTRATVFGGSGFIGRHLAAQLVTSGLKVRVAVRHADRISDQHEDRCPPQLPTTPML
jgi:nucleoside-diphosphate-sugar epimerase